MVNDFHATARMRSATLGRATLRRPEASVARSALAEIAKWQRAVSPYFDFLLEHGFTPDPKAGYSEWYGTAAVYRSRVSAVQVTWSLEFDRVEVELVRLVDGQFPDYQVFFSESAPVNRTLLDNVVVARAPDRVNEIQEATGLKKAAVERQLALWSQLLRDVAADFLAGQQTAFDEAKAVIRERVREHPQRVVVWLPDTAPPEEDSRALQERRAQVPPEVEVVVRRYRRPRGPAAKAKALFRGRR